ncbi:hypothetical protein LUZ60_003717 [Juncus effusus]|nr:hypothetical protein LUZ60_003717 [Juncus effusus]
MKFSIFSFSSSFFFFFFFFSACTFHHRVIADATVAKTITVGQSGGTDFNTVQDAINSVPDGNNQWIRINVTQGTYKEKVTIPKEKQFILLEGQSTDTTIIQWDSHSNGSLASLDAEDILTIDTATFTVNADNFVARQITFQNSYDYKTQVHIAVAAAVGGDNSSFYNCKFLSFQDTLCDFQGRHYFSQCWIEGAVDFIFGQAASVYDSCTINSIMGPSGNGWVTAHAKITSNTAGFVFKGCRVTGTGSMYLGRAWNTYSTVVFYNTAMDGIVVPAGWDSWGKNVNNVTYAESGCTGAGSDTTNRVKWEKTLQGQDLNQFITDSFNNADGWISQQPS